MPGRDPCQILGKLLATMQTLRAPDGCPWDAEQTPESLAPYILEEACETIEAIESGIAGMVMDELGDLLLQIVFQSQIFSERGDFDFADVAASIDAKLVRRHPHVFATRNRATTLTELADQWENLKRDEQSGHSLHPVGQIPVCLPALQRAQKLLARALRLNINICQYISDDSSRDGLTEEELGMALFSLVRHAELNGLDAEQALRRTVRKILADTEVNRAPEY